MEDFRELALSSLKKKAKDDSEIEKVSPSLGVSLEDPKTCNDD